MGIYKQGFDYKYRLDKDVLILKTGHGQYKFKIENAEVLENVHNIATFLLKELRGVEEKQETGRDGLSHYARLLLATLNISEKYTRLEKKYEEVRHVLEGLQSLNADLKHAASSRAATSAPFPGQRRHGDMHGKAPAGSRQGGGRPGYSGLGPHSTGAAARSMPASSSAESQLPRQRVHPGYAESATPTRAADVPLQEGKTVLPPAAKAGQSDALQVPTSFVKPADTQQPPLDQEEPATTSSSSAAGHLEEQTPLTPGQDASGRAAASTPLASSVQNESTNTAQEKQTETDRAVSVEPNQETTGSSICEFERAARAVMEKRPAGNTIPDADTVRPTSDGQPAETDSTVSADPKSATAGSSICVFERAARAVMEKSPVVHTVPDVETAPPASAVQPAEPVEEESLPVAESESGQPVEAGDMPVPPSKIAAIETEVANTSDRSSEKLEDAALQDATDEDLSEGGTVPKVPATEKTTEKPVVTDAPLQPDATGRTAASIRVFESEDMEPDTAGRNLEQDERDLLREQGETIPQPTDPSPLGWYAEAEAEFADSLDSDEEPQVEPHHNTFASPSAEAAAAAGPTEQWIGHDVDRAGCLEQQYGQNIQSDAYELPLLSFLRNTSSENLVDQNRIRSDAELLEKKLGYFGIKGEVMGIHPGPVITTYEYKPDPGIKISKIVNLADDLALALSAYSIRIVAPIPGKDVMGIEIPNIQKNLVPFIDIVTSTAFKESTSKVPICLGKDIVGNPVVVKLESMPHLLIAGATGTGKSVGLNAMITSILYKATPDEVRFLMVDPKRIELSFYNDIPHLLTPVITDMNKANTALQWLVREMDRRYNLLADFHVRHIEQFNQKLAASDTDQYDDNGEKLEALPYIVVIIDELADLMMTASRDIEFSLTRLAQMARAAGIHLILATQRPSVDVLTGIIKANFPTRISFQVSSKTDSRTIIDSNGAETLLGNGDMLFVPPGTARLTRVHGTYLSEDELVDITTFIKKQRKPDYIFDVLSEQEPDEFEINGNPDEYDEKYNEALDFVMTTRQASISGVQRALRVGYNRAARIIDLMEKNGVVGPSDGVKPRKVLVNTMNMM